jgi:hypothetical protein
MKRILQAFKRLFSKSDKVDRKKVYICDPSKAVGCSKDGCWKIYKGPCKCTCNKKYAMRDEDGKVILATDDDLCNFEWLETSIFNAFEKSQKKQGL